MEKGFQTNDTLQSLKNNKKSMRNEPKTIKNHEK
jgi:hypothetical protein